MLRYVRANRPRAAPTSPADTTYAARDLGVKVLTLYAFSSENWRRSDGEISDLTALMRYYLDRELDRLMTEPGETDGHTAADHLMAIRRHAPTMPIQMP